MKTAENKILLLGATGRTGKYLLEEAIDRGFSVNILIRDTTKVALNAERLKVFEGNPADFEALTKASQGCNIVISALNISRTSDFPWAKLRAPKNLLAKTIGHIIELNNTLKFQRIIVISAWGVAETKKDLPFWFRWLIDYSNIKFGYLAHEQQEKLLECSNMNWTSVRPVGLTNFEKLKPIITSQNNIPKPKLVISRKNTAHFILDIVENGQFINQTVSISE